MNKELLEEKLSCLHNKMTAFKSQCAVAFGDHNIGYDIGTQQLIAVDGEQNIIQTFPVIFIGSHSPETDTFMWAWANEQLLESAKAQARVLIDLSSKLEMNEFTAPLLTFKEDDSGYYPSPYALPQLLSIAIDHLGAASLERFDFGNTDCFIAVMKGPR